MGTTLATTLTALGSIVDFIITQIGSFATLITSHPLLFIPFGVIMVYSIINVVKRLF